MLGNDVIKLAEEEYQNLLAKNRNKSFNADFFRKNMFMSNARGSNGGIAKYKKPKLIYDAQDEKIYITHKLHQKHADVLTLIFSSHKKITKPLEDGSFYIYFSLYEIAKLMGYKEPHKQVIKVKNFIQDLRDADFYKEGNGKRGYSKILGDFDIDNETNEAFIKISGMNARAIAYSTGMAIKKELNIKIIQIEDKYVKMKSLIRYVLSHRASSKSYGYTLQYFVDKFEINNPNQHKSTRYNNKARFKKSLIDNRELLLSFHIIYDDVNDKIYYKEQLDEVKFIMPVIVNVDDLEDDKTKQYVGKTFKLNDVLYEIKEVTPCENKDDFYTVKLLDTYSDRIAIVNNEYTLDTISKWIEAESLTL